MWQVRTALSTVVLRSLYDLVVSPKRRRAAGDNATRDPVLHHASHDGNADPCHVRRFYQGRTCVERHDARPALHDRFMESHLRPAKVPFSIT